MKGKKMIISGVLIAGFALGASFGPTFGFAADAPAKAKAYNNAGMGMYMGQYFRGAMHDVIAEKLGMTAEELYQARLDGKAIADLLIEKDIDVDKVVSELVADREAELKQMVTDKIITQYQMDYMLKLQKANIEAMVDLEGIGPGVYRGGGSENSNGQAGMGRGLGGCPMWW